MAIYYCLLKWIILNHFACFSNVISERIDPFSFLVLGSKPAFALSSNSPFLKFWNGLELSHKIAQAGLGLAILLPQPPRGPGLPSCSTMHGLKSSILETFTSEFFSLRIKKPNSQECAVNTSTLSSLKVPILEPVSRNGPLSIYVWRWLEICTRKILHATLKTQHWSLCN